MITSDTSSIPQACLNNLRKHRAFFQIVIPIAIFSISSFNCFSRESRRIQNVSPTRRCFFNGRQLNIAPINLLDSKRFKNLHSLNGNDIIRFKIQIINLIMSIHQEGAHIIDPLSSVEFDEIWEDDRKTSFSEVLINDKDEVQAVLLARPGDDSAINKAIERKILFIEKLGVSKGHRNQGIAKSLFNALVEKAKAQQFDEIRVLVYKANGAALDVYLKIGFDYVNKEKDEPHNSYLLKYVILQ